MKDRDADTLSPNMDSSSLELISASHDYSFYLNPDGVAEWTFNNIDLPDSTADEPGSHGYIQYRISPKNDLQTGDQYTEYCLTFTLL